MSKKRYLKFEVDEYDEPIGYEKIYVPTKAEKMAYFCLPHVKQELREGIECRILTDFSTDQINYCFYCNQCERLLDKVKSIENKEQIKRLRADIEKFNFEIKCPCQNLAPRDGVEPPTQASSGLRSTS